MQASRTSREPTAQRYRPSRISVFAAAFVAGAVAAFGLNSLLDSHLSRSRPQVESVPIFVALRSLPQGSPVTVWDVALRDWPKAMLPTTALKAEDSFEGMILRHPLREGQPLLSVQLMRAETQAAVGPTRDEVFAVPTPATHSVRQVEPDLWTPVAAPVGDQEQRPQEHMPTVAIAATPVEVAVPPAAGAAEPTVRVEPEPTPTPAVAREPTLAVAATEPEPAAAVSEPSGSDTDVTHAEISDEVAVAVIEDEGPRPTPAATGLPVPASPVTDIERPLKSVSNQRLAQRSAAFTDSPYVGPAVAESVLTADTAPAPVPNSPETPSQPLRYLVVPERIALEADTSFTAPPAAVQQPPQAARTSRPQPSRTGSRTPTGGATANRPEPKSAKTAAASPSVSQRPLGAWFPNMAAGLDALGGSSRGPQPSQPSRSR